MIADTPAGAEGPSRVSPVAMMNGTPYPPQEPFSPVGLSYHNHVMALGATVSGGEVIAYGNDPYQQVLLYRAMQPTGAVLAFIHGGGWTNGYKEWLAFMAPALTRAGITFASIGYRLAPNHLFPAGLEDCADGLMLIREHTNTASVFLGGHSAGGHHAALLAVRREWWARRGLAANPLLGCLPVSGVYFFGEGSGLPLRPRFLGSTDTERAASPMRDIADSTPFLIAYGERDFPHLTKQAQAMMEALQRSGNYVERLVLPNCDHFEASYAAGDPSGEWLMRATEFIARYQTVRE